MDEELYYNDYLVLYSDWTINYNDWVGPCWLSTRKESYDLYKALEKLFTNT